jgi:hypothetical protein
MLGGWSGRNDKLCEPNDVSPAAAARRTARRPADVNRFRGHLRETTYLAVWMNLMTPLPRPSRPKFRLTML